MPKIKYLSRTQVAHLFAQITDFRDQALFVTIYHYGGSGRDDAVGEFRIAGKIISCEYRFLYCETNNKCPLGWESPARGPNSMGVSDFYLSSRGSTIPFGWEGRTRRTSPRTLRPFQVADSSPVSTIPSRWEVQTLRVAEAFRVAGRTRRKPDAPHALIRRSGIQEKTGFDGAHVPIGTVAFTLRMPHILAFSRRFGYELSHSIELSGKVTETRR